MSENNPDSHYAILQETLRPIDVMKLGEVISDIRSIPLADASRLARHAYGILDENVPSRQAYRMKSILDAMDIPVFLVPMSHLKPYPTPIPTRNADCLESHFNVELLDGCVEEIPWDDVRLVSCGTLIIQMKKRPLQPGEDGMYASMEKIFPRMRMTNKVPRVQLGVSRTKVLEKLLVRILCHNPTRSFQIDKDEFNFDYLGSRKAMNTIPNMTSFLKDLTNHSPNILLGQNVVTFLNGDLREVQKFHAMTDFDEYNQWLFHWCERPPYPTDPMGSD